MKKSNIIPIYVNASFTLEAAVIYPFTIILLFSFIFLAFYVHDKNLAHSKLMRGIYSEDISLSADVNAENLKEYTIEDLGNYTFTESYFDISTDEKSDNTYIITTYHNNTFIPYLDNISYSYVTFPNAEICRKINYYQSLYLLTEGD